MICLTRRTVSPVRAGMTHLARAWPDVQISDAEPVAPGARRRQNHAARLQAGSGLGCLFPVGRRALDAWGHLALPSEH